MTNTARIEKTKKRNQRINDNKIPVELWHEILTDLSEVHNIPPQISSEAVKELREKRGNWEHKKVTTENGWELVSEINKDLDILLLQQQDG